MADYVRAAFLAFLIVVLGAVCSPGRAETPVKSNFDVMKTLASDVCAELVSGMPADLPTREIRLSPFGTDERYELVGNMFTRTLAEKGYRAYLPVASKGDSSAAPDTSSVANGNGGLRLEFETIEFSLRYPDIYRSRLIGGKNVKRSANVRILARLVQTSDGYVAWMSEASKSYADEFSYDYIKEVEESLYSFTKPPHESRNWGKIVEPVVVSGIIVGLIYLFFSNQGD